MRIYGTTNAAAATPAAARRAAAGGFKVSDQDAPRGTNPTAPLRMVGGIDALVALQGVEDATERRRRSVKRGRHALDVLDELKIGLLGGAFDQSTLRRLKAAAGDLAAPTGDPALDAVLGEIDLRVEVELAKAGMR